MDGETLLTCEAVISFLDDYAGDGLATDERREFDRHLERCASCRAYLATYRATIAAGRLAESDPALFEVPPDLVAAILAARSKG